MSKQTNKTIKKKRRQAYLKRKKTAAKTKVATPSAGGSAKVAAA